MKKKFILNKLQVIERFKGAQYKIKAILSSFCLRIKALGILNKRAIIKNGLVSNGQEQTELDKKLVFSLSKSRVPSFKQFKYIKRFLSWREIWLINFCLIIILVNSIFLAARFYKTHLQVVPINGGEYIEGLVGTPKYINPLYASVSDVDSDIASLVFSSLFKRDRNGDLVNDLVEEYEISQDNKVYTFKIKQKVNWHSGGGLTVDDILFTFNSIKDKQYQSPLRASFYGVELEKIDETTIKFTLKEPYAAFLELLTFGILPQDLWQQIPANAATLAQLNLKPVGSGPYKFKSLIKDKSGNIKSYSLVRNKDYYKQVPFIEELTFKFFPSFEEAVTALNEGLVDGISYLPRQVKDSIVAQNSLNYYQLNLPQLTAIFFNQKANPALADKKVRQALAVAIDKNKIISEILGGEARLISGPILPDSFAYYNGIKKYKYNSEEAVNLLDEAGWKLTEITADDIAKAEEDLLSEEEETRQKAETKLALGTGQWRAKEAEFLIVKLTTIDNAENKKVAEAISEFWQAVNIKTIVEFIPASQIQTEVIKPRNFTALFYSAVVGADPDPYVFWHSSQIGSGGLNITDYANKEIDALLEDARLTCDLEVRKEKYKKFQDIITEEVPAIFMYSPFYTYVQTKKVKGFGVKNILSPHDRFANISEWYIKTGKKLVWD